MPSHTIPEACFHVLNAVLFITLFLVMLENEEVKLKNEKLKLELKFEEARLNKMFIVGNFLISESLKDNEKLDLENEKLALDNENLKADKKNENIMFIVHTLLISKTLEDNEKLKLDIEKFKLENEKLKADVARFEYGCERAASMYVKLSKYLSRVHGIDGALMHHN
jgi:cell division protein FtsB